MAITARQLATTITKFVYGATEAMMRNRKFLAIINDRGNMTMNNKGNDFRWQIQHREHQLVGLADSPQLTFNPANLWVFATLPYRGYTMTDAIGIQEKSRNDGDQALIKVYDEMAERMMASAESKLGEEFYIDGNLAANVERFHGMESFLSASGATASTKVATNNDSYGGLNTALADKGGTWTGTWPTGTGDSEYDYHTPLLVNYNASGAGGFTSVASTTPWRTNCIEAMRYGIIKGRKNKTKNGQLDLIMLTDDMFQDFLNAQDDKTGNRITRGEGPSGLWRLGFAGDTVNFDGIDVTTEYGVPADTGYGIPLGQMELKSNNATLIDTKTFWDINSLSDKFALIILGNLCFKTIRNFVKFASY